LDYVFNPNWAVSNNSYSLSLAVSEDPCYVISGDLFLEPELIEMLEKAGPNLVLTAKKENRPPNTLNCSLDEINRILEVYPGKPKSLSDPEAVGLYKISDPELLIAWKRNCVEYTNLFIGQNLPLDAATPIYSVDLGSHRLDEVNTPLDYIRLLQEHRRG
jgi:choline kinase